MALGRVLYDPAIRGRKCPHCDKAWDAVSAIIRTLEENSCTASGSRVGRGRVCWGVGERGGQGAEFGRPGVVGQRRACRPRDRARVANR